MKKIKPVIRGRAWVGTYDDGELGFCMPRHISRYPQNLDELQKDILKGTNTDWYPSDFYRVEVTIRLVRDKNGKPIVKRNPFAPREA